MSDQDVTMNDVLRHICETHHFKVVLHGDGFLLTDNDPVLKKAKRGAPKTRNVDLTTLIMNAKAAQELRNGVTETVLETVIVPSDDAVSETVETVVETETIETEDEELETEDELEEDEDEPSSNVVKLRRAVITPEDLTEPPSVLTDVVLDDTGKKIKKATVKKVRQHKDNRFARSYRTILENPEMTVAEQAAIAGVTPAMHGWYEIVLRSLYKIIYEKYGDDVIPMLPKLIKK